MYCLAVTWENVMVGCRVGSHCSSLPYSSSSVTVSGRKYQGKPIRSRVGRAGSNTWVTSLGWALQNLLLFPSNRLRCEQRRDIKTFTVSPFFFHVTHFVLIKNRSRDLRFGIFDSITASNYSFSVYMCRICHRHERHARWEMLNYGTRGLKWLFGEEFAYFAVRK